MTTNLYREHPLWKDHGVFWRCRHGHTMGPCWRCGVHHPLRWLRHLWSHHWSSLA